MIAQCWIDQAKKEIKALQRKLDAIPYPAYTEDQAVKADDLRYQIKLKTQFLEKAQAQK